MPNKTAKHTAKDEPTGVKEEAVPRRGARKNAAPAAATIATAPAPTKALKAAGAPMAVVAGAEQAVAITPTAVPALKPLGAIGVDEGVFALLAVPAAFESVESVARYAEEPLPHLTSAAEGSWLKRQSVGGAVVYVAFVPWPKPPAGLVKLGCVTAGGRKPVFGVECLRWGATEPAGFAPLLKRYGRLLSSAFEAVLPATHPLRRAVAPSSAPTPALIVRGHFDGIVDELAHGWAYCPSHPDRHLTLEVLCAGEVVARGLANQYRDDLKSNGFGNGYCHFRLVLSSELFDGQPHELTVRVAETGALLTGKSVATLPLRQPSHIDVMTRAEVLALVQPLVLKANVRDAKALQALTQALKTASLQQETGQTVQARAGYERLLQVLGPNALCHVRVAETWLLDNVLDGARAAYEAAVQVEPGFAWGYLGLGNVLYLQGQAMEADAAYRAALAHEPGLTRARKRLEQVSCDVSLARARLLLEQGDRQGAKSLLTSVLIEQPEHPQAMAELDELLCEPVPQHGVRLPETAEAVGRARRLLDAVLDEVERRLAVADRT